MKFAPITVMKRASAPFRALREKRSGSLSFTSLIAATIARMIHGSKAME
jgi:hypothetical protein